MKQRQTIRLTIQSWIFAIIFAGVCYNPAPGLPVTSGQETSPFVAVAEQVLPCVVNISAERRVRLKEPSFFDFGWPFNEFFRELPVPEQNLHSLGSGVIISADGYIVTNNHVVSGYDNIIVKLSDGTEFKGNDVKIVGTDPQTDLAVIKINTSKPLPAIKYADPNSIRVGDWAIAIGNPYGLQGTVTVGVISAKGRSGIPLPEGPSRQDFIQTDAAINPGNSGGPLVNIRGELIGINTALSSPVGANVGIGFAVPVSFVKSVTEQLIAQGRVIRGYLGIRPQEVTDKIRQALKLSEGNGVLISEVLANTPAEKAGLEVGDVIVEVNGKPVKGVDEFRNLIASLKPGTEVVLSVYRNGRRLTKRAVLAEFPEESRAQAPGAGERKKNWLGMEVSDLFADEQKTGGSQAGVKVIAVEKDSPAADAGIQAGDVILKIGDNQIENKSDFDRIASKLAGSKEPLLFYIKRNGQPMFVAIQPDE